MAPCNALRDDDVPPGPVYPVILQPPSVGSVRKCSSGAVTGLFSMAAGDQMNFMGMPFLRAYLWAALPMGT